MMPLKASSGHAWHPPNPYKSLVIVCKYPSSWLDPPDLYETCVLQDSQETVLAMRHINLKICKESCATFLEDFQHVVKRCRTKQGELLSTWFWGCDFRCSKVSTPEMLIIVTSLRHRDCCKNSRNSSSKVHIRCRRRHEQSTKDDNQRCWLFPKSGITFHASHVIKKKWQTPRISFMKSFSWISFERFPVHTNTIPEPQRKGFDKFHPRLI